MDWQAAWIARAALRASAWEDVQRAIAAMSPSANGGQADPAWRYWKARALVALGDPLAAQPIYVDLAKEPSYYGLLAAEEINAALPTVAALNGGALKLSEVDFQALSDQSPAAKRVLKLSELGLQADAAREWYSVVKDYNDADSLAAAEMDASQGIWDRSINTAERTKAQHDFSLRFQMPYKDERSKGRYPGGA